MSRSVPRTLFERVAADLRQDIHAGRWAPGEALPSVRYLALEEFGVSTETIGRALRLLEEEELIEKRTKSRAVVRPRQRTSSMDGADRP